MTQREEIPLNGTWDIIFDPSNVGKANNWATVEGFSGHNDVRSIEVPSCWERYEQDYEGVAWYRRKVEAPAEWTGRSVRLQFDAVNYETEIYVNDSPIHWHEGGYTGFEIEIGDLLEYGEENWIIVRVIGPIITRDVTIDGLGMNEMPHWRGAITGGIWQPVRLLVTDKVYIKDVFVLPDIHTDTVKVRLEIESLLLEKRDLSVGISTAGAEATADITVAPLGNAVELTLEIGDAVYWDVDNPHLYTLKIELRRDDEVADAQSVRFGMREFTLGENDFLLNGEKIFLNSTFYEGLYPHGLAYPESEELIREEMRLLKEAGFNMLRPWRKPQPSFVYDIADEMGMMLVGVFAFECMGYWPTITPQMSRRIETDVRESIMRDRNHPCIVLWEIFNEILRPELARMKHPMSALARKLDPTRLVCDEAGGFAGGAAIYPPYSLEPVRMNDVHCYPGAPIDNGAYDSFLAISKSEEQLEALGLEKRQHTGSKTVPGVLTNITEIGYGSLPDLEANVARFEREGNRLTPTYRIHKQLLLQYEEVLAETGADKIFPTVRDYCLATQEIHAEANKLMIEAARINPDVNGIGVHAFTDGDWVIGAGLVDLFRNPKKSYYASREVNQKVYLAVRTNKRNIYRGEPLGLKVTCANDLDRIEGTLKVSVGSEKGETVTELEEKVAASERVTEVVNNIIATDAWNGYHTVTATLTGPDGKVVTENAYTIRVYEKLEAVAPERPVSIMDVSGRIADFLNGVGIPFEDFSSSTSADAIVLVSCSDDDDRNGDLVSLIESGGTAAYVDPSLPPDIWRGTRTLDSTALPRPISIKGSFGLWTPYSHIIRRHPVARGLPADCIMGRDYENVYPRASMVNLPEGEHIVTTIGCEWFAGEKHRQDYRGVKGPVIHRDLTLMPYKKGRALLSTLRLIDNLGSDPVADRLLLNIINWLSQKG